MQRRERQLQLGLDARDLRDTEAGRLTSAVVHHRRLADARLAGDDEHRALSAANVRQQPVERVALAGTAQRHRRARDGVNEHTARELAPGGVFADVGNDHAFATLTPASFTALTTDPWFTDPFLTH